MSSQIECAVIGGGLAGLIAASRLEHFGISPVLFDRGLPQASGELGGFARFSGAKFSLLPAGQGLIPVAGSVERLEAVTEEVLTGLGLDRGRAVGSHTVPPSATSLGSLATRSYSSIVLTPAEIAGLTRRLSGNLTCRTIPQAVSTVARAPGGGFSLADESGAVHSADSVLYAGGRNANNLLEQLNVVPQAAKGIDVGVRVEFADKNGLSGLRGLGPDAKILSGPCRTFCLNVPGEVYRYPFNGISIPGGVVADATHHAANVGLLVRSSQKQEVLNRVRAALHGMPFDQIEIAPEFTGPGLGPQRTLFAGTFGDAAVIQLEDFISQLSDASLVDLSLSHRMHFPLIDWHWPTYAKTGSAQTSEPRLYVAGDSAGHARGLLQAAVSGWLAAEEIANERR